MEIVESSNSPSIARLLWLDDSVRHYGWRRKWRRRGELVENEEIWLSKERGTFLDRDAGRRKSNVRSFRYVVWMSVAAAGFGWVRGSFWPINSPRQTPELGGERGWIDSSSWVLSYGWDYVNRLHNSDHQTVRWQSSMQWWLSSLFWVSYCKDTRTDADLKTDN